MVKIAGSVMAPEMKSIGDSLEDAEDTYTYNPSQESL